MNKEIEENFFIHNKPYEGDNGIQFEAEKEEYKNIKFDISGIVSSAEKFIEEMGDGNANTIARKLGLNSVEELKKIGVTSGDDFARIGYIVKIETTRVVQWMSKTEYEQFLKTREIPRTNVLTNGKEGYTKQADMGDYYVEFDIDSSLLVQKDSNLGWSLIKSKNNMYIKLAEKKGITLPDPIGTNIIHVDTKR